jgi:hypothetical protein
MTKKQRKTTKKSKKLAGKLLPDAKPLTPVVQPPDPC